MYHYKETPGAMALGVLLFQHLHELVHIQIQNAADIDNRHRVDLAISRFNMSVVRPAYTEFLCHVGLKAAFRFTCLPDKSAELRSEVFYRCTAGQKCVALYQIVQLTSKQIPLMIQWCH